MVADGIAGLCRINWFRGRSSQVKTYPRPYSPKQHGRPAYDGGDEEADDLSRRRRRRRSLASWRRQLDGHEEEQAAEDAIDRLKEELGAADSTQEDDPGLRTGMMPSDGSQIKDEDDETTEITEDDNAEVDEDETGNTSETDQTTADEVDPDEDNPLLADDTFSNSPSKLPVGPTKAKPLVAKPNAVSTC